MKHQSRTAQLNNAFFSWLRFSVKEQMKRWQILVSLVSRLMITYIYVSERLTAKWFHINVDDACHYITDYYEAWLFSEHWKSLQAVSCRPGEFDYLTSFNGLSAAPNHQSHLRVRHR